MKSRIWIIAVLTALAGCNGGTNGSDAGPTPNGDSGNPPGTDTGVPGTDTGVPSHDTGTPVTGFHCTTGTLVSGFPNFDADPGVHATEGDPLAGIQGHPLGWREVVFVGNHIATVVGEEVWSVDLSAASPTVHRVAGLDSAQQSLADGPCASARFANLQDIEATSDGNLFVMDQTGNAILRITHPFDAAMCNVEYWAGTSTDTPDITPDTPPNVGNTNGAGASAQFALPGRMAIDSSGNLYVWDEHNASIRKVANDAMHTVSTFAPIVDGTHDVLVDGMTVMGSSVYIYAHDTGTDMFVQGFTLAAGTMTEIVRGQADIFGFDSTDSLQQGGITTDGTDLFVYFKGGIFVIASNGTATRIAGDESLRSTIEFDSTYDPMVSHPALMTQLANRSQYGTAGADSWLQFNAGHLYFVGSVLDPYVERFDCSR